MSVNTGFEEFQKIARLSRECVITEKIDGTNAAVNILTSAEIESLGIDSSMVVASVPELDAFVLAQSRTRNITPKDDNFGFAKWVSDNTPSLVEILGHGRHFGEWWGAGIQRRYDLKEKRFSLFNTHRWGELEGSIVSVVPTLYSGPFDTQAIDKVLDDLRESGSVAAPGFMKPEGIVIYHKAANSMFKKTIEKDDEWKSKPPLPSNEGGGV